jgi:dTDP-4-amino-4,6-dideoxygalactose transaminase
MLRDHGSSRKYEHAFPGYNLRMEGLQGGILSLKLRHLDSWNRRRRDLAALYNRLLQGSNTLLPVEMPYASHVYHLYVIQTNNRDDLRQRLAAKGIETGLHYPVPLHLQEAYRFLGYKVGDFPVSERLSNSILSLPMYPELLPRAVGEVAAEVLEVCSVH